MVRRSELQPATPAATLYFGNVMHARLKSVRYRFSYRVMSLLIDLDRLQEADKQSRLFAVNRAGLFSFHEADHGERNGASLNQYVRRVAAERGIGLSDGRIHLLCYPRLLGYVFNPLSIYFCHRACGKLALLIYEVRNTFGEMHSYVLDVEDSNRSGDVVRQSQAKQFYVSPFIDMRMRYHFRVSLPGEEIKVRILETDDVGVPVLAAAFSGKRHALNSRSLLATFLTFPLFTVKVVAAIHWQALRLWLKGTPLAPRPVSSEAPRRSRVPMLPPRLRLRP